MRRTSLLVAALALAASPAAAQHCWPTEIALLVRDEHGAVIDPQRLMDSMRYSPPRGETEGFADFAVARALVDSLGTNRWNQPGGTPAISWHGRGDCRVDMREVVLRRGGRAMRLWMDLHLDSDAHPVPSDYLLEAPPFAEGTWRLDVCALPEGNPKRYVFIPARWVRVADSGDAPMPWQPPQGCGGAR